MNKSIDFNDIQKDFPFLKSVSDQLDKATPDDLVFYHLTSGKKAMEVFRKRLEKGNPGLLILNIDPMIELSCPFLVLSDQYFLSLQKESCDFFYPFCFNDIKIIGITGTNGKTSVGQFLTQILNHCHFSVLTIGTLGFQINGQTVGENPLTTPSYICLRKKVFQYKESFEIIVMELSSHGLIQNRLREIKIDLGIWTNFTRDHLDYHRSMDEYFVAKEKIFDRLVPTGVVILPEEEIKIFDRLKISHRKKVVLTPLKPISSLIRTMPFLFRHGFMYRNILLAMRGVEEVTRIDFKSLDFLTPPTGRFSVIEGQNKIVVIDYAHTPDALKNLLEMASEVFKGKKLNLLFGCGGERDLGKRTLMGLTAQKYADKIYITSDNPRREDPYKIIKDMTSALDCPYTQEVDRKKAIIHAINELNSQEVLLIAGKGHENYQEVDGVRHDFNDMDIVKEIIHD